MDEGVRDFLRVPANPHIKSLADQYESNEILPIPLAAQLMGSDPDLMAEMTREMELRGAHRVDLNCGCPSNTVTGRGAGSSLLKDPEYLYRIAQAMVKAVSIPVTAKLRSGFDDISLFKENLFAAQESGIKFLTLHPRTKVEGYGPPARWELIAEAKSLLKIPLVGNRRYFKYSRCFEHVAVNKMRCIDDWKRKRHQSLYFHQIKAHFAGTVYASNWSALERSWRSIYLKFPPVDLKEGK